MTNNKQQTAVEWFAKQMEILHYDYWAEHISKDEKNQRLKQLKEQAKEMDKERLTDAYRDGKTNGMDISHPLSLTKEISADEYYNETYGGGEQ